MFNNAMMLNNGLIINITPIHPNVPNNGMIRQIRNDGRKLTIPMLCSMNTDKLIMPYVIKKNMVKSSATLSNVPKIKVINTNHSIGVFVITILTHMAVTVRTILYV